MKVKIKKLHPDAIIPKYAKSGDAGMDLVAVSFSEDSNGNFVYDTGLAFEIPEGHVGLLFPRSSIAKYDLSLSNAVGVIDSGYRGPVQFKFKPMFDPRFVRDIMGYSKGERIGQIIIIPYPQVEFEEISELSETERGTGGWGSSGN